MTHSQKSKTLIQIKRSLFIIPWTSTSWPPDKKNKTRTSQMFESSWRIWSNTHSFVNSKLMSKVGVNNKSTLSRKRPNHKISNLIYINLPVITKTWFSRSHLVGSLRWKSKKKKHSNQKCFKKDHSNVQYLLFLSPSANCTSNSRPSTRTLSR